MYDLTIIGTGPAGISAALTAKARNLNFLWLGSSALSSKIEKAERIMNYPGLLSVSGKDMSDILKKQIDDSGIEITNAQANAIYDMGSHYTVSASSEFYETKTIIIATGMATAKVIDGEERLLGNGVSYCATCDGALYKGKTIAVVCTDKNFEEEIEFLSKTASDIHLFTTYKEPIIKASNIEHYVGIPDSVNGSLRVESVTYKNSVIPVNGVFFLKESVNPKVLLSGLAMENNHIIVNRDCETNMHGVYAAGDCTGLPYQYTKATGEGNIAVHSVLKYLKENKE